jgi:anthranilate synthase/aminodeoxychorismate synthase-like glutamine amidotransferase
MILVIDNYDSFTWNLVQYLGDLGASLEVFRNDRLSVDDVRRLSPEAIVISPGPGTPADAGISIDVVREFGPTTPILGVCLGHQAIAESYGGRVVRATELMHGKTSLVEHDGLGMFENIHSPTEVMRYHSLTVSGDSLPMELTVTAWSAGNRNEIHAMRHRHHPVFGVQFHPESVMTPDGRQMLANFLRLVR